jgi:hypothetical protein
VFIGMSRNTSYWVGVRAYDGAENFSTSNVVQVTCQGDVPEIHGEITSPTTLDPGPYWVTGPLTVTSQGSLICGAGVVLKMNPLSSITCEEGGQIEFKGDSTPYVVVTSEDDDSIDPVLAGSDHDPQPGDYASGLTLTQDCKLDGFIVKYARDFGIRSPSGTSIRNGEVCQVSGNGIEVLAGEEAEGQTIFNVQMGGSGTLVGILVDSGARETVLFCTVYGCSEAGVKIHGLAIGLNMKNTLITGCAIGVWDRSPNGKMTASRNGYWANGKNHDGNDDDALSADIV